jgi:hypothetical protein
MIRFLRETEVANEVRSLLRRNGPHRMAVAFWGAAAVNELSLGTSPPPVGIVCNLTSGGTNPKAIKDLIKGGHKVRSDGRLHAKIYLCGDSVILGSSNASANGLALEDAELTGWIEGNIVTDDAAVVQAAVDLFERSLKRSVEIDDDLMKAAELAWARARERENVGKVKRHGSLLEAIRGGSAEIERLPIRFVIEPIGGYRTPRAENELKRIQDDQTDEIYSEALSAKIDCWEHWPNARPGTYYLDFGPTGQWWGLWRTPKVNHIRGSGEETITLAYRCRNLNGFNITRSEVREIGELLVAERKKPSAMIGHLQKSGI